MKIYKYVIDSIFADKFDKKFEFFQKLNKYEEF